MEMAIQSVVTLIIGGFLGGWIKSLLDYRSQVFSALWNERLSAYKKLWMIMKRFPLWPKSNDVTYSNVFEMSIEMRDWYFDTGGMLMSQKTRSLYGDLQKEINNGILKNKKIDNIAITPEEYDRIQELCSAIRSEMTKDLLSRKKLI